MAVATYTKTGTKAQTPAKLDKKVFGVEVKDHALLKNAYLAYLANGRDNFATTKTRGKVSGGGAKPWRQKGTGRARVGSSRNPIWRGGGVAFGPTGQENFSHKVNTKSKRTALCQALSLANSEDRIRVIEAFSPSEGKTKQALQILDKIGAKGSVLLVVTDKNKQSERATRNLQNIKLVQARYLQVFHILNADEVVIERKALDIISQWLTGGSAK